jgi:RNA polymerase sigma-70 factor, ECF subfamily
VTSGRGNLPVMSMDWAEVYRVTYPELVRYLYRRLWDTERAHELAQETFVRALEHDPDEPRGWLFRVAGNLAADEIRTVLRRRRHLTLVRAETDPADPRPDPLKRLEAAERKEGARAALAQLAERDREVLLLRSAGMGYAEIAAQTGLAHGAVGTTLSRARRRLAEAARELGMAGEGPSAPHDDASGGEVSDATRG